MLAEERRQQILETLNDSGSVRVNELSKNLSVTKETIRKDLELLNQRNLLKRTHGGALAIKNNKEELAFNLRKQKNVNEKQQIAKKARELVEPGDTLFLDASSTCLYFAREILDIENITIVTNSVRSTVELAENKNISIITTGGLLRPHNYSLIGPQANEIIKRYNADKFFASCTGISAEIGATDSNDLEIEVKRNMSQKSKETFLLVDHTKFNHVELSTFVQLKDIKKIITDNPEHPDIQKAFNDFSDDFVI